jgi:uncharacterized protein with PIN domain
MSTRTDTSTTPLSIILKKGKEPWYINCICVCPICEQETQLTSRSKMAIPWRAVGPNKFAWTCENCDQESEYERGHNHEHNGSKHPRLKARNS